jgi:hypothetical protein
MLRSGKHYSQKLTEAYEKNGVFKIEVLEYCTAEELKTKEQKYLTSLTPELNLYKVSMGSTVTFNSLQSVRARMQRPTIKKKISKSIFEMHANMTPEQRKERGVAISAGKLKTPTSKKEAAIAAQKLKISQPVASECGKVFVSKSAAAEHLGVTKSAVCQAIKQGRAIGGMMLRNTASKK